MTIFLGDFNADLFREDEVSTVFADFLEGIGAMTTAQSHNDKSKTYTSATKHGNSATLDYIAVPRRWIPCCERMQAIGAPIPTDHKVVMSTFRYRWKDRSKQKAGKKENKNDEERDFSELANVREVREEFDREFCKALAPLGGSDLGGVTAFEGMERLKQATDTAAAAILPTKGASPKAKVKSLASALVPAMKLLEEENEKRREQLEEDARLLDQEHIKPLEARLAAIRRDADATLRKEAGRLIDEHLALVAKDPFHAWQRVFALEKKLAERRATTITMQRLEVHFSKLLRKNPSTVAVMLPEQRPWEKQGSPPPKFNKVKAP